MTSPTMPFGSTLTSKDYSALNDRWIDRDSADRAGITRVDSATGRTLLGRNRGDMSGLLIPYPGLENGPTGYYRIRRDLPDLEIVAGGHKEKGKYLAPPGRRNCLYFPPGIQRDQAADPSIPIIITEGEFKTLSLWRLSGYKSQTPRFLPIGIGGVWNWRGTVGKTPGPNGERLDEKGVIPDFDLLQWAGRQAVIAFDADISENSSVRAARWELRKELGRRGASVAFLEWDRQDGKGIDDLLAKIGPDVVLERLGGLHYTEHLGWKSALRRSKQGVVKPLLLNAVTALRESEEWAGRLAFDEMAGKPRITGELPIRANVGDFVNDAHVIQATLWLQSNGVEVGIETVRLALGDVSLDRKVHPIRQYLKSLVWDGEPRVDRWLQTYCHADVHRNGYDLVNYVNAVGRAWLVSGVARVMQPGCKVDCTLVLEGRQGIGKSRMLQALVGPDWFVDHLPDLHDKDSVLQLSGKWIIELSEMDSLSKSESSTIKAFLSRTCDRYRAPYDHVSEDHPRQCVFAATTNSASWAKDETGGRRFWPVYCTSFLDVDGISRDRDQLWAEALKFYDEGYSWWLENYSIEKTARQEQATRFDSDVWQETIESFLADPLRRTSDQPVTVEWLLRDCLRKNIEHWTQGDKIRVARSLVVLGYERRRTTHNGLRVWNYVRPEERRGQ